MKSLLWTIRSKVGYRGSFLLFLALLNFLFAKALWHPYGPLGDIILTNKVWAVWWFATGIVDGIQAFMKKDKIAFACSAGLKTAWAITAVRMWATSASPTAWIAATIWIAFAGLVMVVSGWPEPLHIVRVEDLEAHK